MSKFVVCLVLLACTSYVSSALLDVAESSSAAQSPRLMYIAQAEGKAFFAENGPQRNWTEASEFCKSVGMKLASITTPDQYAAIDAARNLTTFFGSYWTAGRDAQVHRQISWDGTDQQPGAFLSLSSNFKPAFQTCLVYNTSAWVYLEVCSMAFGTLCENRI